MKRMYLGQRKALLAATLTGAFILSGPVVTPAVAQLDTSIGVTRATTKESATSQRRINQLDDDTSAIVADYRATIKLLESLREYNAQLRILIKDQEREMVSLKEQLGNVTDIEREMLPLINKMIEALELFITMDLPFLKAERMERVEGLKALSVRADISTAEMYRKTLEAYQIENDYGRTVEAYEGKLEDGRTVDFLKVGRVAYYYQTKDKNQTAHWVPASESWAIDGSSKTRDQVNTAIKIANEYIPPDIMIIPVPAATSAE